MRSVWRAFQRMMRKRARAISVRSRRRMPAAGADDVFETSSRGDVAIITMAHGKANAHDSEFCDALAVAFNELRTAKARAVVLTGQGTIFSAGVDLLRTRDAGPDYVRDFLPRLH